MGAAVRKAISASNCAPDEIAAFCVDSTSCTVMALGADGAPLRPCLLWMDARAGAQCSEILEKGRGDPALAVNCDGAGPLSAEWMLPKALWLKQNEPEVWAAAATICECQDYLNLRVTGRLVAGGCNVATRWHCDGAAAAASTAAGEAPFGGRPTSLLAALGLDDLADKWPAECVAMGGLVGRVTAEAAAHLGLPAGLPVAQGGADAYVGLVGLGAATRPGAVGLITGSSHLHLAVVDAAAPRTAPGVWGAYRGAPLASLAMAEGGQSSTGAALQWARRLFAPADGEPPSLKALDAEAAALPVGAEGVVALETFQGARTPATDPLARGALVGLSLRHGRAHVWRALLEAVCLGTRASVEALAAATGAPAAVLLMAGGATRSDLWLQMHADATGVAVEVGECADAPLLGGAILAAALALHADAPDPVAAATAAMVRPARRIEPDAAAAAAYDALYRRVYRLVPPTLAPLSHRLAGGAPLRPVRRAAERRLGSGRRALVVPSLLSADAGAIAAAARDAEAAGAEWLHVDVFDGSAAADGALSSLGPQTVAALRRATPDLFLDVHCSLADPAAQVGVLAAAGAHRITFQLEALDAHADGDEAAAEAAAFALCEQIRAAGCAAGVCLAPRTPAARVAALVDAGAVDLVDVLAVEPGRGGQPFQRAALAKVAELYETYGARLPYLMVDGGVNAETGAEAAAAGANVLVSGSTIFGADDMAAAIESLSTTRSRAEDSRL